MRRTFLSLGSRLLPVLLAACSSHEDSVCESTIDCAQGGDSTAIQRCKDEAKALQGEASAANCGGLFDDYYSCADSSFTCSGATPSFPGCDAKRAALEACLTASEATNACGQLAARTSACSGADGGADGATGDDGGASLTPACTVARVCQAQCYLDHVSNACAPRVDELADLATCSASCPP
jgi:hypothetical protein